MTTAEEQLFETRKAMLLEKLEGQSVMVQQVAVRNLQRMQFQNVKDYNDWLDENFPEETENEQGEVSEEQMEDIMGYMGFPKKH